MAITQNYVDYNAGNDTTGDGTVGTPWKTLQKAFDTLTRETNDGNQVNLKAGTAHVNAAALDLATLIGGGALSGTAPLIIRGYTSAANDGGIGEIDCNGAAMWAAATYDFIILRDLEIHNGGNNDLVTLDTYCHVVNCEFHKGASTPSGKTLLVFAGATAGAVLGCYFHNPGTNGYCTKATGGALYYGNHFEVTSGALGGISLNAGNPANIFITRNIFRLANATGWGIYGASAGSWYAFDNSFFNSAAGVGSAVTIFGFRNMQGVVNNLFEGWSGVNGEAIDIAASAGMLIEGYNAFRNCTATITAGDVVHTDLGNDDTLGSSPFVNAGAGDFDISGTVAGVTEDAYPAAFLGLASTSPKADKGAVQAGAGGAADYPSEDDVRSGTTYSTFTGNMTLPPVGDVRDGETYGTDGTEYEGTLELPAVAAVLDTVSYGEDGSELTGTYHAPDAAEVIDSAVFGPDSGTAGTYDTSGEPATPEEIAAAVWAAVREDNDTAGSFGAVSEWASTGGLDAAGVRAAIGMASANLDTQIATLATSAELADDTEIAAAVLAAAAVTPIEADLQTWKGDTPGDLDGSGNVPTVGGGLSAQETADAVHNLAPVGDVATGSIGAKLNSIYADTAALTAAGTYAYSDTVDDGSGNLLDGVRIECATDSGFTNVVTITSTNASGAFTVRSDQAGTHYLRLQLAGYEFADQTVTLA